MLKRNKDIFEAWATILVAVIAIVAIKSIFEDDNSKIVSKKGRKFLLDKKKMKDINEKILESEDENEHQEIII